MRKAIAAIIGMIIWCQVSAADDLRYCGRSDSIVRSEKVKAEFQRIYPCPVTGRKSGSCPGWSKDHVIPLDCGGCDSVANMQWMKNSIKSCAGTECKDRWERKVYCKS